jgi:hypothetical protein
MVSSTTKLDKLTQDSEADWAKKPDNTKSGENLMLVVTKNSNKCVGGR